MAKGLTWDVVAIVRTVPAGRFSLPEHYVSRSDPATGLTAILHNPRKAMPLSRAARRRALAHSLLTRQRVLEALHARGDCLAARPGETLSEAEVPRALAANSGRVEDYLAAIQGREQLQVSLRAPSRGTSQNTLTADLIETLAEAACDTIELPVDRDMLANLVCLVPRGAARLEAALEAFDARTGGVLAIALVGPLPPISFQALTTTQLSPAALEEARSILGLPDGKASVDAIEQARKSVLRRHAGVPGTDVNRIKDAAVLLTRAQQSAAALSAAGLSAAPLPPLFNVVRTDQAVVHNPKGVAA